ncbi:enoyl-CoA hydratase [Sutcliffiella horikoshii]|uniref:enoyl-CoA hydratase n=1 Tax=Sutcliffiella horikoshii TaxID=79883 RepID=UPI0007D04C9C|nr:enoyl-CoA hydratase [Sutcliffiella horikoshii]MCM3619376.1 enoyl-CoA hydratase [Sutcliffiella horikoshii]
MEFLQMKVEDRIAVITINKAPANALSSVVLKELSSLMDDLEKHEEVRVVLLHGEGRFFSAGADIKEFTTVETGEEFAQLAKFGQDLFERMENFPKPIIAAIHGAALGGGLELAMGCHIRLVTKTAKLGLPELQLGLIPGFAGTQRLPKLVGTAKAFEMLFTSDTLSGEEAVQWGLANKAVDEEALMEEALKMAKKIAQKGPISVASVIELSRYAKHEEFYQGVDREAQLFGKVFTSEDGKEGITAFMEKRAPEFKGK